MDFTIKKLAKLMGVTVRTIHHYDAIGLLKPAYCGENGYRYYREEQLLILKHILFYRELGFKLNDIKKMLYSDNDEQKNLLKYHKIFLNNKVIQIKNLIQTIDETIAYLEGERLMMSALEMRQGFFENGGRGEIYAAYFLAKKLIAKEQLDEVEKRIRTWDSELWKEIKNTTEEIIKSLAICMKNKLNKDSVDVQNIIELHYILVEKYLPLNKNAYIGLGKLYCDTPQFRNFFNGPKNPIDGSNNNEGLVEYLAEGMRVYAENKLTASPQNPETNCTMLLS